MGRKLQRGAVCVLTLAVLVVGLPLVLVDGGVSSAGAAGVGGSGWVDPGLPVSEVPEPVGAGPLVDGYVSPSASFPDPSVGIVHDSSRVREIVEARTASSERWLNVDGSFTEVVHSEPVFYRPAGSSVFVPIDGRVVADSVWPGWFRNAGNSWSVWFGPLVSSGSGASGGVVIEANGVVVASAPVSSMSGRIDPVVDGEAGVVTYRNVWPNVDVRYSVRSFGVKEDLVVTGPISQSSFPFSVSGSGLSGSSSDGGVSVVGSGDVSIAAPSVSDRDGADVTVEARPELVVEGPIGSVQSLRLVVDRAWLLSQQSAAFPLVIDPTLLIGASSWASYGSTPGYFCDTSCGHRVGNAMAGGDMVWRSLAYFPYESVFVYGKKVVSATLNLSRNTAVAGTPNGYNFRACWASAWSFDGAVGNGCFDPVTLGDSATVDVTQLYQSWVDSQTGGGTLGFIGQEQSGLYSLKELSAYVAIVWNSPPPSPANDATTVPADQSVFSSLSPTLSINPVTDLDGDALLYGFTVATADDGYSGGIVASGPLQPASPVSWTVTTGALRDGQTYYWRAWVWDLKNITWSSVRSFTVNLRLGTGGPSPMDKVGPVSVNLATGNATFAFSTQSVSTVGGSLSASLTYNSLQPANSGLRGTYFNDNNVNRVFDDDVSLTRDDAQVNFDWKTNSPAPQIGADNFLVKWDGYINLGTGTFNLGVRSDDGVRVVIDGSNTLIDDWHDHGVAATPTWSVPVTFNGTAKRIHIEYYESNATSIVQLWSKATTQPPTGGSIVPASAFTTDAAAVPAGWTFSSGGTTYVSAQIGEQSVVLRGSDGTSWEYGKGTGSVPGWVTPEGRDDLMVTNPDGTISVIGSGGLTYLFTSAGQLKSITTSRDDRRPVSEQRKFAPLNAATDPVRLTELIDPVSGVKIMFNYFGGSGASCPTSIGTPTGMLCRIGFPDGSTTDFGFDSAGRLVKLVNPGNAITTFAYNAAGRIITVVDPLANDAIAAGLRTNDATVGTAITYVAGKAISVKRPAPSTPALSGESRFQHSYTYGTGTTAIATVGVAGTASVAYDGQNRRTVSTDATGRSAYSTWDDADRPTSTIDSAGVKSTRIYDSHGWLTDTYGPGPAASFTGLIGNAYVTHNSVIYDDNISSLAAAWYSNGDLAGTPILHTTGIASNGQIWADWTTPPNSLPASNYGVRLTGDITFPTVGTYTMSIFSKSRTRLWLDDNLITNSWSDPGSAATVTSATFVNSTANSTHRVRIDVGETTGQGSLGLAWTPPGSTLAVVPTANLEPRYGLPTAITNNVGANAESTIRSYSSSNGIGPEHGLVTAITADPSGLALTTTTTYEAPSTTSLLRPTGTSLPAGTTTATAASYYGNTETRSNPCNTTVAANQGGRRKLVIEADPDGFGTQQAIQHEFVYDMMGRVSASRTGASGAWTCASFDTRGRTISVTHPAYAGVAARTVTNDYAVGGNPLTVSTSDPNGTIVTTVDLLGRATQNIDAVGIVTTTSYDQAGSVSATTSTTPTGTIQSVLAATYDAAGRTETVTLAGSAVADPTYDSAGRLSSVTYPSGTGAVGNATSGTFAYDINGRAAQVTWAGSVGVLSSDQITARDGLGRVTDLKVDGVDPYASGVNFVYDRVGRLAAARTVGHNIIYSYANSSCGSAALNTAGRDTNRTQLIDNSISTSYCYDNADRLTSSSDPTVGTITYDDHGNTTAIFSETHTYDDANRHLSTTAGSTTVSYVRDALDRIVERKVNGATVARYGYVGSSDSPSFVLDANGNVAERTIGLPGGVNLTVRAAGNVWSYPNLHGDTAVTATQAGTKIGTTANYDSGGNQTSGTVADNAAGNFDNRWLGQYQRPTETEPGLQPIIEMGARQYSPRIGRFLQTDPITGGSANAYAYVFGDPANTSDLSGLCGACWAFAAFEALFVHNPGAFMWGFGSGRYELRSEFQPPLNPVVPRYERRNPSFLVPSPSSGTVKPGIDWGRIESDVTKVVTGASYVEACLASGAVGVLVSHGIPVVNEFLGGLAGCGVGIFALYAGTEPVRK